MAITVRSTTFRTWAVILGAIGLGVTISLYTVSWIAIGLGVLFGAGGLLIDWRTDSRHLGGQLSGWALVAGGGLLATLWLHGLSALAKHPPWPDELIQYISAVYISWGLLMFLPPLRVADASD